jgi:DNA-binding transcriptional LysR family regulator
VDVAIRAANLEDSSLVARHLFANPMLVIASPRYLQQHGAPREPADLKRHNCIVYALFPSANTWHFSHQGKEISVPVTGTFQSDNGDTNLEVVLSGLGITELPIWMVDEHLRSGRLIQLLTDYQADELPFNAIYPQNRYVPLKARCFVDFMKEKLAQSTCFG